MIVKPIHTGTVNGHPVRFFRSPLDDGRPDLPWHGIEDLMTAAGVSRDMRRALSRRSKGVTDEFQTVATDDGLVVIAPHPSAQGLLGAVAKLGRAPASVEREYQLAGAEALDVITAGMPFDQTIKWACVAARRWGDLIDP